MNMTTLVGQAIEAAANIQNITVSQFKDELKKGNSHFESMVFQLSCAAMAEESPTH